MPKTVKTPKTGTLEPKNIKLKIKLSEAQVFRNGLKTNKLQQHKFKTLIQKMLAIIVVKQYQSGSCFDTENVQTIEKMTKHFETLLPHITKSLKNVVVDDLIQVAINEMKRIIFDSFKTLLKSKTLANVITTFVVEKSRNNIIMIMKYAKDLTKEEIVAINQLDDIIFQQLFQILFDNSVSSEIQKELIYYIHCVLSLKSIPGHEDNINYLIRLILNDKVTPLARSLIVNCIKHKIETLGTTVQLPIPIAPYCAQQDKHPGVVSFLNHVSRSSTSQNAVWQFLTNPFPIISNFDSDYEFLFSSIDYSSTVGKKVKSLLFQSIDKDSIQELSLCFSRNIKYPGDNSIVNFHIEQLSKLIKGKKEAEESFLDTLFAVVGVVVKQSTSATHTSPTSPTSHTSPTNETQ